MILKRIILRILNKIERVHWDLKYDEFRKKYDIHPTFGFSGQGISFNGNGKIICGKDSYIGRRSVLVVEDPHEIRIGEKCRVSYNVSMFTISGVADQDMSSNYVRYKSGDIIIGDYVWIGANVFINPNIKIGSNSVIGANSVVTHDISPNVIAAGSPAEIIGFKSKELKDDYIHKKPDMLKIKKKF
jgi:maltose O-acetyltransferase